MSADLLREAATLMRERAESANEGPWVASKWAGSGAYDIEAWPAGAPSFGLGRDFTLPDAMHIASWHPGVALAVADWLDAASHAPRWRINVVSGAPIGESAQALKVARAYLGRATCPGCGEPHDPEPCRREAADCDCCQAMEAEGS